jgi:hypothetical protein
MIIRKAGANTEAGMMPSEELVRAMMEYNQEMVDAGIFVGGHGLKPSAKGARVQISDGEPVVTDGPFSETKELIAGYTMINVGSLDEAIAWAKRWPPLDGPVELEIRPVYEVEDLGDGFTPELRTMAERQRAAVGAA